MKKLFSSAILILFLISCNNSSQTDTTLTDSTGGTNTTGTENVNGNLPDSNSGMQLNKPLPVDSSRAKDSARH